MKFSRFFIDRPIFAMVLSVVILLAGGLAYLALPTSQYPDIVPPTVQVTAMYPGADPKVIADTVATPIEQEVNGVENMLYMASRSTADGTMTLDVTFKLGTSIDIAQVLVQNRVAIAQPRLPEEVRTLGVNTKKKSPNLMMVVNLPPRTTPTIRPTFPTTPTCKCATCCPVWTGWAMWLSWARASTACACGWTPTGCGRAN